MSANSTYIGLIGALGKDVLSLQDSGRVGRAGDTNCVNMCALSMYVLSCMGLETLSPKQIDPSTEVDSRLSSHDCRRTSLTKKHDSHNYLE